MKDYVTENDQILNEWKQFNATQEASPNFSWDGIINNNEKDANDVNKMWSNAPIRFLFITKDQNTKEEDAWDVREENVDLSYLFNRNLVYLFYGLTHIQPMVGYDDFTNDEAIANYNESPIARINVKKQAGSSSVSNPVLVEYMERDKDFIVKQITNLDADVLVCCGFSKSVADSGNLILNFLNDNIYHFQRDVDNWIYYDSELNKIAINAWHLSYRGVSSKYFYEELMKAYQKFVQNHPEFLESHRK